MHQIAVGYGALQRLGGYALAVATFTRTMGGGNGQKSATARARNEAKKAKSAKGSQLAVNEAACNIVCQVNSAGLSAGSPCVWQSAMGIFSCSLQSS